MTPAAEFRQRLHTELVRAFDLPALTKVAQFDMDVVLTNVVWAQTAFDTVAFEFVGWCHRCGRLGQLITAAAKARTELAVFQALRQQFDQLPPEASPTDDDFRRFAKLFNDQLPHLEHLQAYKKLHDILHDLDGKVEAFEGEAVARAAAGTPIPAGTADDLQRMAAEAEEWRQRVALPDTLHWVGRFRAAVDEFLGADPAKHDKAFRRIKVLPSQELEVLNSKLTDCVHRVEVGKLAEMLDWRLDGLAGLAKAVSEFRRAGVRVRDLATAHDGCQFIDRELRGADEGVSAPSDLVNWDDVRKRLDQLGALRPTDPNAAKALAAAAGFEAGTAPGSVDPFAHLVEKFATLFERVDKELLDSIQPLLTAVIRLSNSLGNPK